MRHKLNEKFRRLFKKEKKPYFPAPCSEYDSSATVTLSSYETCSNNSIIKIRKRDHLKNKLKHLKKKDKNKSQLSIR